MLGVSFAILVVIIGRKYDNMIEVLGFSAVGSLVVTTAVSILSVPVIALIAKQTGTQRD